MLPIQSKFTKDPNFKKQLFVESFPERRLQPSIYCLKKSREIRQCCSANDCISSWTDKGKMQPLIINQNTNRAASSHQQLGSST
ncbi:hypothetical protein SORBI_3005G001900 [Sorghum bicolor]|nr:hypothetical protein SORBI_3005G001900 [Sorghum bicolor]